MSSRLDVAVRGTTHASGPNRVQALRTGGRTALVWIIAIVIVLAAAITVFVTSIADTETRTLHPDSTQPDGTRAMMGMLASHGVRTETTESYAEAAAAAADSDTTLLIYDGQWALSDGTRESLGRTAAADGAGLVLVQPGDGVLAYGPKIVTAALTEVPDETVLLQPSCTAAGPQAAGPVRSADTFYTTIDPQATDVQICYPADSAPLAAGAFVHTDADGLDLTVLGTGRWLRNAEIDEEGNAALAMHTLGSRDRLVFYLPQHDDQPDASAGTDDGPDALDLVPRWFGVAMLWLIPLTAAALWWRVRRFGPLAVERLPVVVPPIETVHGRAALMQRAGDRAGALHALRTGSLLRAAARLARPAHERPAELCDAIAAATGRDPAEVRYAYLDAEPADDKQLTAIAALITAIESEVPPT